MSETFNWDEIEESAVFKPYAPHDRYKVKIESAKLNKYGENNVIQLSIMPTKEYQFARMAGYWLRFGDGSDNWRRYSMRQLFMALGKNKKEAQECVEHCENAGTTEAILSAYEKGFKIVAERHPEVEIEVRYQRDKEEKIKTYISKNDGREYNSEESVIVYEGIYRPQKVAESVAEPGAEEPLGGEPINDDSVPF